MELRALADSACAVLDRDRRPVRSSWRLATRSFAPAPSVTSIVPVSSDWRALGGIGGRHELLDQRRLGALAQHDECPRQQRAVRRARDPADGDRLLEMDAGGDVDDDALGPQRPGQLGELVVGRQPARPRSSRPRSPLRARSLAIVVNSTPASMAAARGPTR